MAASKSGTGTRRDHWTEYFLDQTSSESVTSRRIVGRRPPSVPPTTGVAPVKDGVVDPTGHARGGPLVDESAHFGALITWVAHDDLGCPLPDEVANV